MIASNCFGRVIGENLVRMNLVRMIVVVNPFTNKHNLLLNVGTKENMHVHSNTPNTNFPAQFSNTPNTRMPPPRCPWATRPINACCPKRLPLVLGVEGAVVARVVGGRTGRRRGRVVICQRRKHHHHSRGLPPAAPIPTPPRFLHQRFLHRRAVFERSKPFVGAAGPVAVAVDTRRAST